MPAIRDTVAMISGMAPELVAGEVVFASLAPDAASQAWADARAVVREAEGVTLVLPASHALAPRDAIAMRQITLNVHSALDGVGLTAAVAEALAQEGIPCNVLAGFHHDHVFVPSAQAERAVAVLAARAASARRAAAP